MTPTDAKALALQRDLESIVCSPAGLGLTTATPLQRAICRIACGRPLDELAGHPDVIEAVGRVDLLWPGQPDELVVLSPSRTGKSTIVAGLALRAVQTVDLTLATTEGEPPVFAVLSLDVRKARAVYGVIERALRGPYAHLCTREPRGSQDGGSAMVRHPSGKEIEIAVVAGQAGGAAVIARWLAGLAVDEAARMQGSERVINLPATLSAARDRLLPGAQVALISSKWAPWGPVYDMAQEHGGRPSRAKSIVVVGAQGCKAEKLNPSYYTPQRLAAIKAKDEAAHRVAENRWQSPAEHLFDLEYLQRLSRPAPSCDCDPQQRQGFPSMRDGQRLPACPHGDSPPHPRQHYLAVIDPATSGNAWALVLLTVREICDTDEGPGGDGRAPRCKVGSIGPSHRPGSCAKGGESPSLGTITSRCSSVDPQSPRRLSSVGGSAVLGYRDDIALCRQWQGTSAAPLDVNAVWREIADLLRPYRCNRCVTDEWSAEAMKSVARTHGIYLSSYPSKSPEKHEACQAIQTALSAHERGHHQLRSLELHPCPALLGDLARVEKRVTLNGVQIHYPLTGDARHCDLAAALVKGYGQVLQRPGAVPVYESAGERDERLNEEARHRKAQEQAQAGREVDGVEYEELRYE